MKNRIFTIALAVSIFLSASAPVPAQTYLIENLGKEKGLSNNNVRSILQDKDGFLWIGTKSGLDRYDGYTFEHISVPGGDSSRLSVYSLWQDSSGRIWMATSRGLFHYDHSTGQVSRFEASFKSCKYVSGTSDGKIWVMAEGGALWCIDQNDLTIKTQSIVCKFIAIDASDSSLYVVSNSGRLYVLRNGSESFEEYTGAFARTSESERIYSLNCVAGKLFVGTLDGNLIIDVRTGEYSRNNWPLINQVAHMASGDFWVATKHGVYVLDSSLNIKERFYKDSGAAYSIIDNYTLSIIADRDSGVWVGTYFAGLSHLVPNKVNLRHYFPGRDIRVGCNVREIMQDSTSNVWIGTNADGLYRLSVDGKLSRYPLGVPCRNILGLFADGGTLWIGLNSDHDPLLSLDLQTGTVSRHRNVSAKAYAFSKSPDGRLWIGCDENLYICSKTETGALVIEETRNITHIRSIIRDSHDRMWVASVSKIGMYSPSFNRTFSTSGMSVEGYFSDVFESSDGQIWITTDGGDLLSYCEDDGEFRHVPVPSEYGCDKFFKIVQDTSGVLWVTSSSGMLSLNPQNKESMILVSNEELSISNFNYSSNYCSPQGIVYAGTTDGFVSFDPKALKDSRKSAEISLTSFSVLNTLEGDYSLLPETALRNNGKIALPSRHNSFDLHVSDFNFGYPRADVLTYQLEGYSDEWRRIPGGVIRVRSLQSGKYTLRLKYSDSDFPQFSLDIEIKPPFFLRLPFLLLLAAAVAFSVWIIIRKERRRALSSALKAAEEESRIREVESEKNLYASKVEFLSSIAHEIKTPLMLISLPVKSLQEKLKKSADKTLTDDVEIISRNAERLSSLIEDLLDFGRMETTEYKCEPMEFDVSEIIRNVFDRFALSAKKKNVDFRLEMAGSPIVFSVDRNLFEKLAGNLFSNALKYCSSYVLVKAEEQYGEFRLTVTNDGEVVPEQQRSQIFKPFVRYSGNKVNTVPGTGIGLYTSTNFASLMGGALEMDDDMSVNRFVLSLPVIHQIPSNVEFAEIDDGIVPEFDTTVMLVEDDEDARLFFDRQLAKSFNIIKAADGREAIELLEKGEMPSIIVSDVVMSGTDGFELCRYVKGNITISHIPVILLTAVTTEEAHIQGLDVGADAYLQKPVSIEVLLTTIRNILQNRKSLLDHFMTDPAASLDHSGLQSSDILFLRRLQEYINENMGNPDLKNEDVAGAMCVSSSALFKKVKALTGMSPMEYLQRSRLNKAAELLSAGVMSITNVCYASGFNTPSYFAMVFKRRFGVTPREWGGIDKNK